MLKDKDLDKLFKSKFEGANFEPDASAMEAAEQMVDMTSSGGLDQLFRDKFAGVSPTPPAESVAQMERLLASQKGFAWGRFGLVTGVILLFLSAGIWFFTTSNSSENSVNSEEIAVPNRGMEKGSISEPFESLEESENIASEEEGTSGYSPETTSTPSDANVLSGSSNESGEFNTSSNEPVNSNTAQTVNTTTQTEYSEGGPVNSADNSNVNRGSESPVEVPGEGRGTTDIANNTGGVPPGEKASDVQSGSGDSSSGENSTNTAVAESSEESVAETETVTTEEDAREEAENVASNSSNSEPEEAAEEDQGEEEALATSDEQQDKKVEEGSARNAKAPGFDNRKGFNSYWGLIAGLSVAPSFDAGDTKKPVSTNVVLGVRYAYQIRPELTLNINALYSDRTGINQTKEVHDTIYHFGMATRSHYITPTRLHYVETPIYISWQMDRNHSLSIGASPAVLIGQNNRLDLVSQDSFDNRDYQTETHTGRSEGILNYDVSVMMGYTYRVNEYWSVGVRGQYGLFDVTNNAYYGASKTHRNIYVRFLAEYKLPF